MRSALYSTQWAITVYRHYLELSPRAEQIIACISQLARDSYNRNMPTIAINGILVGILSNRGKQGVWRGFKRLVAKSPLDIMLLDAVTRGLISQYDSQAGQNELDFT